MPFVFKLPDVGEGMAEGEIVQWYVNVGDTIEEDEPLLELQNDKLAQDIPSPVTGTVTKIMVEVGTVSNVGDPLIEIETGEGGASGDSAAEAAESSADAVTDQDTTQDLTKEPASQPEKSEAPADSTAPSEAAQPDNTVQGRVLAMPSVRYKARELGVDITKVQASGKHGHVTLQDLESAGTATTGETGEATPPAAGKDEAPVTASGETAPADPKAATTSSSTDYGEEVREKMSVTRRAISQAMSNSAYTAPHVAIFDEVEVSKLVEHRRRFKEVAAERGVKLTYLAYITKALVAVAKKYPVLNSMMDDKNDEIVYKHYYNVGIAVDTERGLYVPNVKNADKKSMYDIADEIAVKAQDAHSGELAGPDMRGGTITITNIGSAGGLWFTPIMNFPEVAILGIGRIEKKPFVNEDGEVAVGQMLALSMSFDHRVIDGATAQMAMNELKRLLGDPEALLMEG